MTRSGSAHVSRTHMPLDRPVLLYTEFVGYGRHLIASWSLCRQVSMSGVLGPGRTRCKDGLCQQSRLHLSSPGPIPLQADNGSYIMSSGEYMEAYSKESIHKCLPHYSAEGGEGGGKWRVWWREKGRRGAWWREKWCGGAGATVEGRRGGRGTAGGRRGDGGRRGWRREKTVVERGGSGVGEGRVVEEGRKGRKEEAWGFVPTSDEAACNNDNNVRPSLTMMTKTSI